MADNGRGEPTATYNWNHVNMKPDGLENTSILIDCVHKYLRTLINKLGIGQPWSVFFFATRSLGSNCTT